MHAKRQYESRSFPRCADHTENNAPLRRAEKEIISRNQAQISVLARRIMLLLKYRAHIIGIGWVRIL